MARQQASRPLQINWRPRRDIENVGRVFSVVCMVLRLLMSGYSLLNGGALDFLVEETMWKHGGWNSLEME